MHGRCYCNCSEGLSCACCGVRGARWLSWKMLWKPSVPSTHPHPQTFCALYLCMCLCALCVFVNMCVSVSVCMRVCECVCVSAHTNMSVCVRVYMPGYPYLCMCVCVRECAHTPCGGGCWSLSAERLGVAREVAPPDQTTPALGAPGFSLSLFAFFLSFPVLLQPVPASRQQSWKEALAGSARGLPSSLSPQGRARRRKKRIVTGRIQRVNMGGKGPRVGGDELKTKCLHTCLSFPNYTYRPWHLKTNLQKLERTAVQRLTPMSPNLPQ